VLGRLVAGHLCLQALAVGVQDASHRGCQQLALIRGERRGIAFQQVEDAPAERRVADLTTKQLPDVPAERRVTYLASQRAQDVLVAVARLCTEPVNLGESRQPGIC
jgi:hypothetical protein